MTKEVQEKCDIWAGIDDTKRFCDFIRTPKSKN